MFGLLVRGIGIHIAIDLDEQETRGVILLLDDVETQHAGLVDAFARIGEGGSFEDFNAFRFDVDVDMNDEQGIPIRQSREKLKRDESRALEMNHGLVMRNRM